MKKQYTATTGFPYKTRQLVAGETFEADEKLGTLLVKMRRAMPATKASRVAADDPQPTPPAPQLAEVVPEPVKTEPEPAPVLAETVVPELPADPTPPAQTAEAPATEQARPAFKSRRIYGSKAP